MDRHDQFPSTFHWRVCRSICSIPPYSPFPETCPPRLSSHTYTYTTRVFTHIFYIVRSPLFSGPASASTTRMSAHTHRRSRRLLWRRRRHQRPMVVCSYNINITCSYIIIKKKRNGAKNDTRVTLNLKKIVFFDSTVYSEVIQG